MKNANALNFINSWRLFGTVKWNNISEKNIVTNNAITIVIPAYIADSIIVLFVKYVFNDVTIFVIFNTISLKKPTKKLRTMK